MAKISFNQLAANEETSNGQKYQSNVGFFGLRNDKEEAIVRFVYDSENEFEVLTVHPIALNGKTRMLNCPREDAMAPISDCPLCMGNAQLRQRFYIKLIQYKQDANGFIVAEPKIWDRPVRYAYKLKGYLDNFGSLKNMVCKIVRNGAAGSQNTDYEIIPNLSKDIYPDNVYVKEFSAFDNYSALGRIVLNKTSSEIDAYMRTGNFPAPVPTNNTATSTVGSSPENTVGAQIPTQGFNPTYYAPTDTHPATVPPVNVPPVTVPPVTPTVASTPNNAVPPTTGTQTYPWGAPVTPNTTETPNTSFERPRRY